MRGRRRDAICPSCTIIKYTAGEYDPLLQHFPPGSLQADAMDVSDLVWYRLNGFHFCLFMYGRRSRAMQPAMIIMLVDTSISHPNALPSGDAMP